jgi:hypothetical protein
VGFALFPMDEKEALWEYCPRCGYQFEDASVCAHCDTFRGVISVCYNLIFLNFNLSNILTSIGSFKTEMGKMLMEKTT